MINDLDIYKTVRTAYDSHLNSLGEEGKKTFMSNYYESSEWLKNYLMNTLTEDDRIAIISKYGMTKFLEELPKIAKLYCWDSYNDFIEDAGDMAYGFILSQLIIQEVLKELDFDEEEVRR